MQLKDEIKKVKNDEIFFAYLVTICIVFPFIVGLFIGFVIGLVF